MSVPLSRQRVLTPRVCGSRSTNHRVYSVLSDDSKKFQRHRSLWHFGLLLPGTTLLFINRYSGSFILLNYRKNFTTMALDLLSDIDKNFWKSGRLETYANWPFKTDDSTCTPERMAAAGFYFIGGGDDEDAVECFACGKQLDGWEASDDPWQEHAKHQLDCPYILLNKPDEMQWTIDDLFNLMKVYYVKDCTRTMNEVIKHMKLDSQLTAKRIPKIYKAERKSRKGGK